MAQIGAKLCPGLVKRRQSPCSRDPLDAKRGRKSRSRKHKLGPQSSYRRRAKRERAAVKAGELDHDREPKAGTGLGLIQPATAPGHLLALLWRQPGTVVVDENVHDP